ncbi:hypothetical protein SLEP1_g32428 [Rubroshorea leprosula]|uniref:NYN domain-containing protein n=1 Tax=Rubroshorea leprosula TaxID=152421 RepID=A0AAV5KDB0_9ROSI|nr:hypothetical protein SLEP1_g32428 [Rubroshorea leprosula]
MAMLAAAAALEISSNGFEDKKKEIDFDLLFERFTQLHQAKCLDVLLLVSAKVQDIFISAKLVNCYAYLGDVSVSHPTFNQIPNKDVFTWNSMASAYVRSGHFWEALNCFNWFLFTSGLQPDFYTFPPVLKACRNVFDWMRVHCLVLKLGFEWHVFVAATLIHMYTWFGLVGVKMDPITVASILCVCAQSDDSLNGMLIHLYAIKHGLELDLYISNALINMYAKYGNLGHAERVFNDMVNGDVVSWNSIIAAGEQNNDPITALGLFNKIRPTGIHPGLLTLVSLSSVVSQLNDSQNSKAVHGFIIRRDWISQDVILGNAIMDMSAKLGVTDYARAVFDGLPLKDAISYNIMITGYAQNGLASEAIEVYQIMQSNNIIPNQGTWVSILPAYSHLGPLQHGMKVHGWMFKNSLYLVVFVGTCLVDIYGKCGRLDDAISLFYEVPRKSSVPWNAIISCLGIHGHGKKALKLFGEMLDEGVKPDHFTFVSPLSACSHSGLVDEGQWCFHVVHEGMPVESDASVWGSLLAACRIHGNVDLGTFASDRLFEVDSENVGYYVLLSNIYANVGKWEGGDKDVEEDEKEHFLMSHGETLTIAFFSAVPFSTHLNTPRAIVSATTSEQKETPAGDSNLNVLQPTMNQQNRSSSDGPVAILWDIENCPVPSDGCPKM